MVVIIPKSKDWFVEHENSATMSLHGYGLA
jgi:hypothetical protein